MKELKMHKVRIIPTIISDTDADGKTIKVAKYARSTKLSENAKTAGFSPDQFYQLELTEVSNFKLGGNPKPFTQNIFKTSHSAAFSDITEEIEEKNYTILSDKVMVLNEKMPGRIVELECREYYGTTVKADGSEVINMMNVKQKNGSFTEEPMVRSTIKFFLFEHEAQDEKDENVAFIREFKRRKKWLVQANTESKDETGDEETTETKNTANEGDSTPE